MSTLGCGTGAKQMLQKEKGAWDEEETEALRERTK